MIEIDNRSIELLGKLKNASSQLIYSERVLSEYGIMSIESPDYWIKVEGGSYLRLSSVWRESEETHVDYGIISVEQCSFDVLPNTSIFSFGTMSIYESIEILIVSHGEDNALEYEGGILLTRGDGKKIIITCGDSAFRNLVLEHDNSQIDSFLKSVVKQKAI